MFMPLSSDSSPDNAGTSGDSYGAIFLPADAPLDLVRDTLRGIRFTGWIADPDADWLTILGDPGDGVIASGRRGVIEVAAELAARTNGPALAVRVRRDRQLAIVAWLGADELGRYDSDPSHEPGADDEVLSDPIGAAHADDFATLCGRPDIAEQLSELLDEELETDSVFESERLTGVLRLLGLPGWLVAAGALPHDIPTGPRAAQLTRLRAGATGVGGVVKNLLVKPARRRRTPPPVTADPPRSDASGFESWML